MNFLILALGLAGGALGGYLAGIQKHEENSGIMNSLKGLTGGAVTQAFFKVFNLFADKVGYFNIATAIWHILISGLGGAFTFYVFSFAKGLLKKA